MILTGNVCNIYDNQHNVKITIADNFKDRTDYIKVALFKNQAEFARKFIKIGDHVSIRGRASTYEGNTGETLGIIAHEINFEGYKNPAKANAIIADTTADTTADSLDTEGFTYMAEDEVLPWEENNG